MHRTIATLLWLVACRAPAPGEDTAEGPDGDPAAADTADDTAATDTADAPADTAPDDTAADTAADTGADDTGAPADTAPADPEDADGDGWTAPAHGGEDCDDADARTHPGAWDWDGDGVDRDCDGADGPCEADAHDVATAWIAGVDASDYAGWALAGAGDLDADGHDDLLVGAYMGASNSTVPGSAFAFLGPVTGTHDVTDGAARWDGACGGDYAGAALAGVGDWDGDGAPDVAIGAYGAESSCHATYRQGGVYLLTDPLHDDVADASLALYSDGTYDQAGSDLAAAGDVTGDGVPDLLVGGDGTVDYAYTGAAWLVAGGTAGTGALDDAWAAWAGEASEDHLNVVAGPGDLDGDGVGEVLLGAPYHTSTTLREGLVYAFQGPVPEGAGLDDADLRLDGAQPEAYLGTALGGAGDMDGDGRPEWVAAAPGRTGVDARVYVFSGSAVAGLGDAVGVLTGRSSGDGFGRALVGPGDMNGDGLADLAVAMGGSLAPYAVAFFPGPVVGTVSVNDAGKELVTGDPSDAFGQVLAAAGDLDGDGLADVAAGAPHWDGYGSVTGAVYVISGAP